jgi:hypothetical protein
MKMCWKTSTFVTHGHKNYTGESNYRFQSSHYIDLRLKPTYRWQALQYTKFFFPNTTAAFDSSGLTTGRCKSASPNEITDVKMRTESKPAVDKI